MQGTNDSGLKARPIWQELPPHFKKSLVGKLHLSDRHALELCSKAERDLVRGCPVILDRVSFTYPDAIIKAARPAVAQKPFNAARVQQVLAQLPAQPHYMPPVQQEPGQVVAPSLWTYIIRSLLGTQRGAVDPGDYAGILLLQDDQTVTTKIYQTPQAGTAALRQLLDSQSHHSSRIVQLDLWFGSLIANTVAFLAIATNRVPKVRVETLMIRWNDFTMEVLECFDAPTMKTLIVLSGPKTDGEMERLVESEQWNGLTRLEMGGLVDVPLRSLSKMTKIVINVEELKAEHAVFIHDFRKRNLPPGSFCVFRLPRTAKSEDVQTFFNNLARQGTVRRLSDLSLKYRLRDSCHALTVYFSHGNLKMHVDLEENGIPEDAVYDAFPFE